MLRIQKERKPVRKEKGDRRQETGDTQLMGPGGREGCSREPTLLLTELVPPALLGAQLNVLPWAPGNLSAATPKFPFLPKLSEWVLLPALNHITLN